MTSTLTLYYIQMGGYLSRWLKLPRFWLDAKHAYDYVFIAYDKLRVQNSIHFIWVNEMSIAVIEWAG